MRGTPSVYAVDLGKDLETIVLSGVWHEKTLIFRFAPHNPHGSRSPTIQIVNYYNNRNVDVLIDVDDVGSRGLPSWNICHETLLNDYVDLLLTVRPASRRHSGSGIWNVARPSQLGGRRYNTCALHMLWEPVRNQCSRDRLQDTFYQLRKWRYSPGCENLLSIHEPVSLMPPHPNIMVGTQTLVSTCKSGDDMPLVAVSTRSSWWKPC
jgi:hypothetical protein